MLHYGTSMATVGGYLTPEVADAFRRSSVNTLELLLAAIELDDRQDGPSRALLRELIDGEVIQVESLHLPFGAEWDVSSIDEAERQGVMAGLLDMLDSNLNYGARLLTLHASAEPIDARERPLRLEQACQSIAELLPFLRRHRMRLAVEYLPRTCLGNTENELLEIVERFDPALVGICLDVNHAMTRYAELPRILETLEHRLFSLHISDYDGIDEKHWFPGQGVIPWAAVMETLRKSARELYLFYEVRRQLQGCDPIFCLRQVENNIVFLEKCCRCPVVCPACREG